MKKSINKALIYCLSLIICFSVFAKDAKCEVSVKEFRSKMNVLVLKIKEDKDFDRFNENLHEIWPLTGKKEDSGVVSRVKYETTTGYKIVLQVSCFSNERKAKEAIDNINSFKGGLGLLLHPGYFLAKSVGDYSCYNKANRHLDVAITLGNIAFYFEISKDGNFDYELIDKEVEKVISVFALKNNQKTSNIKIKRRIANSL